MLQLPGGFPEVFPLFSEAEVEDAVTGVARQINKKLAAKNPLVITLLNGGVVFSGKLLPQLTFPLQQDYLHATRYRDATTGSQLQWHARPRSSLLGRTVLLLDDIYDLGFTLEAVFNFCVEQGAAGVYSAVLVRKNFDEKPAGGIAGYQPDFAGLKCGDEFVIGSGMDYRGFGRNIPGIYAVRMESENE